MMLKTDYSLQDLIDYTYHIPEDKWHRYILDKDPLRTKFPKGFDSALITAACQSAVEIQEKLLREYGKKSTKEYLDLLKINLVQISDSADFDYIYMSTYTDRPPQITIYESALRLVDNYLGEAFTDLNISSNMLREIAMLHELFHHLELNTPQIYTQSKTLEYKALGLFSHKVSPISASELAAVHFSKLMSEISYSPLIYELIILFSQNKILTKEILQKLY